VNFGPGLVRPGATPLEVMMAYQGVRETSPNRGPWIDECLRFVGLDPEAGSWPWCAASLVWCAHRGGVELLRTAGVARLWRSVQARRIGGPEQGCGFVHLNADGTGHCGFVIGETPDGKVATVSGNTNEEGSREGTKVGLHDKPYDYFIGGGFFHLRQEEGGGG